jgi:hypothetical protein
MAVCNAKGGGWGLMPFALWGAIGLWSRKNGTLPRGNGNYGSDYAYPHEKGVPSNELDTSGRAQQTATGSGPATWNHNWQVDGISDMCGNVWEWNAGIRSRMGELQIIPYADCINPDADTSVESTQWRAIMPDGSLVAPGTAGTIKFDYINNAWQISDEITSAVESSRASMLKNTTAKSGLAVPQILQELGIYPNDPSGDYGGAYAYVNNARDERVARHCGSATSAARASALTYSLDNGRSDAISQTGFRAAYYGPL